MATELKITVDKAIKRYVELRDEVAERRAAFNESIKELQEGMDRLEAFIKRNLEETGAESFKTEYGTAFKTYTDRVAVKSWDSMLEFIIGKKAWHFLKKDVAKKPVLEYLEENDILPPGVTYSKELVVQVRRPRR